MTGKKPPLSENFYEWLKLIVFLLKQMFGG